MSETFTRFTERARKVFALAQEEALAMHHDYVSTEHLLLGLLREGDGIAARVLANLGVQLPEVRAAVQSMLGVGTSPSSGASGLTPRAKKVIELAMDEARRLNCHYIGTEHLLLGLVREGEGIAARVLESLGVSHEKVRQQTMQVVASASSYQQSPLHPSPLPPQDKLEAFTDQARESFALMREEARGLNHNYLGTEHLLLGLVRQHEGIAAQVLHDLGVQLPNVRSAVEVIIGKGDGLVVGDPGFTPRMQKVIALARDEARQLQSNSIGTEHLLLGLVREGEGIAAGVLISLGASLETVRPRVLAALGKPNP